MYFIDRGKIENTLVYLEQLLHTYKAESPLKTPIEKLALERIVHMSIEAIVDVGNAMIDGFIMRDPGSYEDIIEILEDETVITKEVAKDLKDFVTYRKALIQSYVGIDDEQINQALLAALGSLEKFPDAVRHYLTEELGPVSAFIPEAKQ